MPYRAPTHWDIDKCYPPNVTERLLTLFTMDILYTMLLISAQYPVIINQLMNNKNHSVFFVTQRRLGQPEKSYRQLRNAGINGAGKSHPAHGQQKMGGDRPFLSLTHVHVHKSV
ncbi:hypothetical protein HDR63_00995 [bacterium]|nr:hypothetical protein [bacterium]